MTLSSAIALAIDGQVRSLTSLAVGGAYSPSEPIFKSIYTFIANVGIEFLLPRVVERFVLHSHQKREGGSDSFSELLDIEEGVEEFAYSAMQAKSSFVKHLFYRLSVDAPNLSKYFAVGTLSAIQFPDADSHNGGNQVAILTDSSGRNVVYKPVPAYPLIVFNGTINVLRKHRYFSEMLSAEVIFVGDGYFYRQYMSSAAALLSQDECRRLYVRYGGLLAVALSLRVSDLHFENLLVDGEFPVAIDVETIGVDHGDGQFTIEQTGLLGGQGLSGISGGGNINRYGVFEQNSESRPAISYLRHDFSAFNRARGADGSLIQPRFYADEIVEGFNEAYLLLAENQSEVHQLLHATSERFGMTSRWIARPTALYSVIQKRLIQANNTWADAKEHALEVLRTKFSYLGTPKTEDLYNFELADLLAGDIPYFLSIPAEISSTAMAI